MRDWKTTTTAALSALASFVLFSGQLKMIAWPEWVIAIALFALVGGLASFGIVAKDYK